MATHGCTGIPCVLHSQAVQDALTRPEFEQTEAQQLVADPLDHVVDGLTVRECLARYEAWQREWVGGTTWKRGDTYLTLPQVDAARSAWSSSLRTLQSEQRERGRVEICVDDDRWEE